MAPTVSPSSTGWAMVRARVTVVKSSRRTLIEIVRPRASLRRRVSHRPSARRCSTRSISSRSAMSVSKVRSLERETVSRCSLSVVEPTKPARGDCRSLPWRGPKRARRASGSASRSPCSVVMPSARRRSAVLGPMPGTRLGGACAKRSHACSMLIATRPRGFSRSLHTLATSLLGPMPTETPRPVVASTSCCRRRMAAFGATRSERSR